MRTNIIYIALSYKYIPRTEVAYTSCFTSSLNISTSKTLVFNFSVLFAHPFAGKKLYYNSSLSLNRSINLINISL